MVDHTRDRQTGAFEHLSCSMEREGGGERKGGIEVEIPTCWKPICDVAMFCASKDAEACAREGWIGRPDSSRCIDRTSKSLSLFHVK